MKVRGDPVAKVVTHTGADRIAWVEDKILGRLASGPATFDDLVRAIPIRRRNLGFALARLTKAGTVVVKDAGETSIASETKSYPLYSLTDGDSAGQRGAEQAHPQPVPEPQSPRCLSVRASTAEHESQIGTLTKPRRRGRPKGFVPGSSNHRRTLEILRALSEYGALTQDDLRHLLGTQWAWLSRPLVRLKEEEKIIEESVRVFGRRGLVEIVVLHLPGQSPIPRYAQPGSVFGQRAVADVGGVHDPARQDATVENETATMDDPGCAACEQIGTGRGLCPRCASKAEAQVPVTRKKRRK